VSLDDGSNKEMNDILAYVTIKSFRVKLYLEDEHVSKANSGRGDNLDSLYYE